MAFRNSKEFDGASRITILLLEYRRANGNMLSVCNRENTLYTVKAGYHVLQLIYCNLEILNILYISL